jgi:hypothetical protein
MSADPLADPWLELRLAMDDLQEAVRELEAGSAPVPSRFASERPSRGRLRVLPGGGKAGPARAPLLRVALDKLDDRGDEDG